jgi:hypothetical protein
MWNALKPTYYDCDYSNTFIGNLYRIIFKNTDGVDLQTILPTRQSPATRLPPHKRHTGRLKIRDPYGKKYYVFN